jgi:hypothetical protein
MIAPEDPPGFVLRTETQKSAWDNGYRLEHEIKGRMCAVRGFALPASTAESGPATSRVLLGLRCREN